LKLFLLIAVFCVSAFAAFAQAPPQSPVPPGINEVYLAKDDGNGHAGDRASIFLPTDIPIYCVVQLETAVPTTVKMNLVAESVPGVKAETNVVSTSYTTKDGQNRVNFTGRPNGSWPPGRYRADIFLDGQLTKNLAFEIKGMPRQTAAVKGFQPKPASKSPPKSAASKPQKKPSVPFTSASVVINR